MSKKKDESKAENIKSILYKDIVFVCPTRGKVTQKVKVVTYKTKEIENIDFIKSSDAMVNNFDMSELTNQAIDDDDSTLTLSRDDG